MVFDRGRLAAEVSAACYCQLTVLGITAECRSWCLVVCHECHLFHYPTREIPKGVLRVAACFVCVYNIWEGG